MRSTNIWLSWKVSIFSLLSYITSKQIDCGEAISQCPMRFITYLKEKYIMREQRMGGGNERVIIKAKTWTST